jgi:hypothetical protein
MLGGPEVWQDFMRNLNHIIDQSKRVIFTLAGNLDALPAASELALGTVGISGGLRRT